MSAVPVFAPPRPRILPTEAALGLLLAVGAGLAVGPRPALVALAWLAAVTPRLTAVDLAEHRLPDRLVLPGYPVALGSALLESVAGGTPVLLAVAVAVGIGYGLLLLLLHGAGGMGLGDVKLAPVLGLVTAAVTPAAGVVAPLLAFVAGGAAALVVLVRSGPGARMPFGPAMLLGAWTAVLLA